MFPNPQGTPAWVPADRFQRECWPFRIRSPAFKNVTPSHIRGGGLLSQTEEPWIPDGDRSGDCWLVVARRLSLDGIQLSLVLRRRGIMARIGLGFVPLLMAVDDKSQVDDRAGM